MGKKHRRGDNPSSPQGDRSVASSRSGGSASGKKGGAASAPAASIAASFWTPRRGVILSVALLFALWLIQFFTVLAGDAHFWEDLISQDYPARFFARTALLSGEFPHWVPYIFNGMPFFALNNPGVLYPFNLALSFLPVSAGTFWYLIQLCLSLHFLIAGVNMFVYMRYKRRSNTASFFGAAAFMFGGFLITHLVHTMMVYIMAWFPLVLLLFERGIRELKAVHAVSGGLLLGLTMLAGHPQISFYEIIFLLSIGIFILWQQRDRVAGRVFAGAVFFAVAAGLCLVQYLPTIEMNGWTGRVDYTLADASEGSLQFVQLLTALIPKVFGAYTGNGSVPAFWLEDSFRHGYYNYWETCFYFGISTLILLILWFQNAAANRNRTAIFMLVWIAASFCIALGGNFFIYRLLFEAKALGFTSFRHPVRILFTWNFLFPLAAAAALDSLGSLRSKKLKTVTLSLCAAVLLVGVIAAAGGLTKFFPLMGAIPARADYASQQGLLLLLNAGLLGTVFILFFLDRISVKTAKTLIAACLAIDMLSFAAGHHIVRGGGGAPAEFRQAEKNIDMKSLKNLQDKEHFRFSMRQFAIKPDTIVGEQTGLMLMNKNQGMVSGIQLAEGYTAMRLRAYMPPFEAEKFNTALDLLNIKYYINPHWKQGDKDVVLTNETYLPRAKLFYRAKVAGGGDAGGKGYGAGNDSLVVKYMNGGSYDHRNEVVVTDQSLAKFSDGQAGTGGAQITKYKFNSIEVDVDTDREAILWLSEIWYPAWKATVNGQKVPVRRANYSFRAVEVPAGKSAVVFKFDSAYFNIGALISLLTLILSLSYLTLPLILRFIRPQKTGTGG